MTTPFNEFAFPWPDPEQNSGATGMTLRDYFAGQALAGMASVYHEHWTPTRLAECAYEIADALLTKRVERA